MAKIEDLIAQIPDERLRRGIAAEVKVLKKSKKFGLVFEEHLPETVRLPRLPVKPGDLVALKREPGNQLWRVTSIKKGIATCDRAVEGYSETKDANREFPVADLVVVRNFGDPIYPALVPVDRVERGGPDKPWHVLINADNFHALQLLLYCYESKVDVIYIDPPYNTGARDWKYNNDYVDKTDTFRHSKWLSMIKKRLLLAKRLLRPEGVLVIAVDDCEVHHLRCLLQDSNLVGEEAFLGTVVIRSKPSGNQTKEELAVAHEYALFMSRTSAGRVMAKSRNEKQLARFDQEDDLGRFYWENLRRHGANSRKVDRPGLYYPIQVSSAGKIIIPEMEWDSKKKEWKVLGKVRAGHAEVWPQRGNEMRVWSYAPSRARKEIRHLSTNRVDGEWQIYRKIRMRDVGVMPQSLWIDKAYSAGEYGTALLKAIFGEADRFSFPKSIYAVTDCIKAASSNPNAVVLDFFGGSGTTLNAVALLNADDGGSRQCILVTNNEVAEKRSRELFHKGLYPGDADYECEGICQSVTWPRCKYALNGSRDDGTELPGEYISGRGLAEGFEENLEYFNLDFLDPAEIARGDSFQAILPILWMMARCQGAREDSKGSQPWFIPKHSPFAVLIKEKEFRAFRERLSDRKDIGWVFLVTDSEENFALMRRTLGSKVECVQLYKSYLENFRLNTPEALGQVEAS